MGYGQPLDSGVSVRQTFGQVFAIDRIIQEIDSARSVNQCRGTDLLQQRWKFSVHGECRCLEPSETCKEHNRIGLEHGGVANRKSQWIAFRA